MITIRLAAFLLVVSTGFIAGTEPALDVLEKNCIECHNSHEQKGDVALDQGPLELEDLQLIIDVVSGDDPEMPPKRDPLSATDIAALQNWVDAGANIPEGRILKDTRVSDLDWWSLKPLEEFKVPNEFRTGEIWPRNEIDSFVLAKLTEKGMKPSGEAAPRTLIRRLTYDLTGLPPTMDEVESFLKATREDPESAYQALVERLLASRHYGEQWARHWLDVARYGESHGYDKDKARFNAWPYRDYVIDSFNSDKPWSRFVQEQVAGDVLWPGDPNGIVALGFVAAGPWDFIAHTEVGEAKVDGRIAKHLDRDDMVSAVFNVFMSTTVQCAQCHNHKFDPVSMDDYYRLHAIFAGVDRADRIYDLDPALASQRTKLEKQIASDEREVKAITTEIDKKGGEELKTARAKVSELEKTAKYQTVPEHGYHSQFSKTQEAEKWIQFELPEGIGPISQIRLIGAYDDYGGIGAGFGFPVRFKVEISKTADFSSGTKQIADYTGEDYINPGVDPIEIQGAAGRFLRITATKLFNRKGDYIFALGEVELLSNDGKNLAPRAKVTAKDSIESGKRWGKRNLIDGKYTKSAVPGSVIKLAAAKKKLAEILTRSQTPEQITKRKKLEKKIQESKQALSKIPKGKQVYTLASDFKPRNKFKATGGVVRAIHLLNRGDITSPGDEMKPGVPAFWSDVVPEFELAESHTEGERRAALAEYLIDPDNPLTWRSAVNRIWQGHFGRGIVASPNDFGRMGMQPTHPGLLDWLAFRFREKQSMKDIHRLIVMSSTYRQSSAENASHSAIDAGNAYYWKMNRRKLRAEELRDSILIVAGVLDLKMGGPSFRDFKFKDDHTPKYWYHLHDPNDPDTHRRTIYRFIARSQTQPFLTTLDCADPSQMVAKRDETTTALQALALMNNPFMESMSEKFAERANGAEEMVKLALGRSPTAGELKILKSYHDTHGSKALARVIFNLNEFAYVD